MLCILYLQGCSILLNYNLNAYIQFCMIDISMSFLNIKSFNKTFMHRDSLISDYCYSNIPGSSVSESKGKKRLNDKLFSRKFSFFYNLFNLLPAT